MSRMRVMGYLLGLDRDQAMAGLPFLVGILPRRHVQKAMVILRCRFVLTQVVVGCGSQKVADRKLRQELGPRIQGLDHQFVVLVLIGGRGQVAVCRAHIRLQLDRNQQLLLGLGKFVLFEQDPAQSVVQVGIVGIGRQQRPVLGLGQIVFLRVGIEVSQIELQRGICRGQLQCRLQFGDGRIVLSVRSQHASQLQMRARVIGMKRHQLAQNLLRFRVTLAAHVNVGQAGEGVGGRGIERQRLLVFLLGVGKAVLTFEQRSGGEVRLGIFRMEQGGLPVGLDGVVGFAGLKHVGQREPGPGVTLGHVRGGLELGGGAQKLFGVGLAGLGQHQSEIEVRFEDIGLGGHRLAIGGNRVVGPAQRVVHKSQVEPGGKIARDRGRRPS